MQISECLNYVEQSCNGGNAIDEGKEKRILWWFKRRRGIARLSLRMKYYEYVHGRNMVEVDFYDTVNELLEICSNYLTE